MRVLMIHDFAGLLGGANRYRGELTRRLRENGHTVALFTLQHDMRGEDVRVFPCHGDGPVGGRLKQHVFHPGLHAALRSHVRTFAPDLIHVQGNHLYEHSAYLACSGEAPVVQTLHDVRPVCPNQRGIRKSGADCSWSFGTVCVREGCVPARTIILRAFSKAVMRRLFDRPDWRMAAPSRALCDNIRHFGIEPVFIPNFTVPGPVPGACRPGESRSIAFVGALYPSKGVVHLIRAFSTVGRNVSSAALDIVGDGPEREKLSEAADDLGIADRVVFHGRKSEEETRRTLGSARALVLPSVVRENCPLVILEAMALGRPVVASRVGGIPELVREGRTGVLVRYGREDDLAEALLGLLEDDGAADRMGEEGRRIAGEEYSERRHMDLITDLYGELTGKTWEARSV